MQSAIKKRSGWGRYLRNSALAVAAVTALAGHQVEAAQCEHVIVNEWSNGYTAAIRIHNDGSGAINGWSVSWQYQTNRMTNGWNAQFSGSNPYTASDMGWNGTIQSGQSVEFGFQVAKNGGAAETPAVTGDVCTGGVSSSAPASSSSAAAESSVAQSSEASSQAVSSSVAQSSSEQASSTQSVAPGGAQCNWYGTLYPLCDNQNSGWGYEDSESCIGIDTCSGQPDPYGPTDGGGGQSSAASESSAAQSSSIASSVASSAASSASSTASEPGDFEGGCDGYATRYWDCCKPHCGWSGNVPSGMEPMNSCGPNNQVLSDPDAASSCDGGNAHMCYGLAPYEVSENLSYGYAATSSGDVCGRCFQIEFTGESYNAPGDPGSAALAGKQMIVQAINIGHDVSGGQFDIMIPGGGVGAFNGCSNQWGVSNSELGAQYGGFLSACKNELGYNASLEQYKSCVTNRCDNIFGSRGLTKLHQGCLWFAEWFEAADNPSLRYREVACPAALSNGSGMNRSALGDISQSCN